jgi:4-carboxymuconolactone decarboxylase
VAAVGYTCGMRVPLIPRDELPDEVTQLLDLAAAATTSGGPPPTIAVLAHQAALLGPFLTWAAALAMNGVLSHRDHELLALRSAHRCQSAFEWREHVEFARAAGITDEEIERVAIGPRADGWSDGDAALLLAADELHDTSTISPTTWAALAGDHDPGALVEMIFVVGQYTMLSMVANAMAIT